ncbi:MAG: LysR family transcriptional regulator [Bdellovibrionales bacterium]|nr:LysR family transcriptional regulator [Bdellovibrionales bacterium]
MEFHDLEVFLSVAKEKSFSRAAKAVLRTQPAVSLSIRRLEEELGERLFDRSNKEPILTYEGELLLDYAERLLNLRSEIKPAFTEMRNLHRGKVKIGSNEIGILFLLPYLSKYHSQFPHVKLEITRVLSKDVPKELSQRNIDLGVMSYTPEEQGLESQVIQQDTVSFVVYPDHPMANQKKVSIRKLGTETFTAHNVHSFYRTEIERLFKKYNVPLHINVELPSIESIKRFVEMGQGVAIIPRISIMHELERGTLKEVQIEELTVNRNLQLVYRRGDLLSHVPKAFLRLITHTDEEEAFDHQVEEKKKKISRKKKK